MKERMWELKQQAETPEAIQLYIYGDVEGDFYDWWEGWISSETSADHFREELSKYPEVQEITVYINSYGGSVFEGTAIYNQLKRHPAHKTVIVDGFACSVASVIAMAGDTVIMPRNTLMMIHNAWMVTAGNAEELRKEAENLDTINAAGRQAYLQKAGEKLTEAQLIKLMDDETWLTAEQCIAYGLADQFAERDADMQAAGEMLQKANISQKHRQKMQTAIAAKVREQTAMQQAEKPKSKAPAKTLVQILGGC